MNDQDFFSMDDLPLVNDRTLPFQMGFSPIYFGFGEIYLSTPKIAAPLPFNEEKTLDTHQEDSPVLVPYSPPPENEEVVRKSKRKLRPLFPKEREEKDTDLYEYKEKERSESPYMNIRDEEPRRGVGVKKKNKEYRKIPDEILNDPVLLKQFKLNKNSASAKASRDRRLLYVKRLEVSFDALKEKNEELVRANLVLQERLKHLTETSSTKKRK